MRINTRPPISIQYGTIHTCTIHWPDRIESSLQTDWQFGLLPRLFNPKERKVAEVLQPYRRESTEIEIFFRKEPENGHTNLLVRWHCRNNTGVKSSSLALALARISASNLRTFPFEYEYDATNLELPESVKATYWMGTGWLRTRKTAFISPTSRSMWPQKRKYWFASRKTR